MSTLRSTIEGLASQFAVSVLGALRSASIDELADVAGRGAAGRRGRPRANRDSSQAPAPRPRGRGGRLGRRSPSDIARMIESIVDLLGKNASGLRAEQIRESLGVEAKELPRPLAEAISSGVVTKNGQKRATTYFAASGSAGGPKRRGRRAGARKKR